MSDIKLKPQMEKPKVLEISRAPKEAGAILKEQYEAQQAGRRPAERAPVQYATDNVETTARRGVALAADGARRGVKGKRAAAKDRAVMKDRATVQQAQEQAADYNGGSGDAGTAEPGQGKSAQRCRGQQAAQNQAKQSQVKQNAAEPPTVKANTYTTGAAPRNTAAYGQGLERPEPVQPRAIRERGRQKAIKDAGQARVKARYLTEKENAAIRGLKQPAEGAGKAPQHIKQKAKGVKTGNAMPRFASAKDRLMTPAAVATKKAKREAQKKMQKEMLKQAAIKAKKAAQETAKATVRVAKAAARAIAAAVKAIIAAGGGVALLVVILLVALIGVIAASPFGIFFSGENTGPDAVPVSVAVAEINSDFNASLEALQAGGSYDDVAIHGAAADWPEVLAVFATKVAGADGSEAADVVTIDRDCVDKLKAVFWDMTAVSSYVQEIEHGDSDPDDDVDDSWTEYILYITITAKTAAEMPAFYGFTDRQATALDELLAQRAMLVELVGNLSIISADAGVALDNLPADLSPERKAVVKTACSLVGKVNYFWGGKSYVIGWDIRWGQIRKVWADGSASTGTYRPYGLDCSGFVDWVFYQVSEGDYIIGHGGGAASQHDYCTDIAWNEALPGDLVFYPGDEHVGIVGGKDDAGNLLIIHCASGYNNVVVTGIEGFTSIGRPLYYP